MVYKKYIKRGGKTYGPYLYKSVKRDGKVITEYHGRHEPKKQEIKHFGSFIKKSNNKKILIGILSILSVALLIYLGSLVNFGATGKASVDIQSVYREGELITGNVKLILRQGELFPADSNVVVDYANKVNSFGLRSLVSNGVTNGNFYIENKNTSGSGDGFGIPGEKEVYPTVTFSFRVIPAEEIPLNITGPINGTNASGEENITGNVTGEVPSNKTQPPINETQTPASNETVPPVNESGGTQEPSPPSQTPQEPSSIGQETPQSGTTPETSQTATQEQPSTGTETPSSGSAGSESSTTSSGTTEIPLPPTETPPNVDGSSQSSGETTGSSSEESSGITGGAISEEIIQAQVSKVQSYEYQLNEGESIEILNSSQPVSFIVENGKAIVTTDYSEIEKGFGKEYFGNDNLILPINISQLGLKAKQGTLKISFVYNNEELVSASKEIKVTAQNISNLTKEQKINKLIATNINIERDVVSNLMAKNNVRVILKTNPGVSSIGKNLKGLKDFEVVQLDESNIELIDENTVEQIVVDQPVTLLIYDSENIIRSVNARNVFNLTGQGKKLCIIDTGVDGSVTPYSTGWDFVNNDNNASDDNGHGTQVAYIAKSVAPDAELLVAKVLDASGNGFESNVLEGLQWCINNQADIISFSIGSGSYNGFCDSNVVAELANQAVSNGIFVVAATGNDASTSLKAPACASKVTRVAATDKQDNIAGFSNVNKVLDVFAPGVDINTKSLGNADVLFSGTSASVPFVSGAAALVLENQSLAPLDLRYRFASTGKPILYTQGNLVMNISRLDVYNAIINNITMIPYNATLNQTLANLTNYTILSAYPGVSLISPIDNALVSHNINFMCNASDDVGLVNVSLWGNWTSGWHKDQTVNITPTGNVLWFHFNNDSSYGENNTYFYDFSGMGHNGTGINFDNNEIVAGKFGNGVYLDGTSDYINVSYDPQLDYDNITISLWVKFNTLGVSFWGIFARSNDNDAFNIILNGSGTGVRFYVAKSAASTCQIGWSCVQWSQPLATGQWYHFALTHNSSDGKLEAYVNGASIGSDTVLGSITKASSSIWVGRYVNNYFNGTIDELSVWNRTLSASEIYNLYQSQQPGLPKSASGNFIVSNMGPGIYNWSCSATDNDSQTAFASENRTIYVGPKVALISPADNYISSSSQANVNFSCNVTSTISTIGTANISLYTNTTGSWSLNQTSSSNIPNVIDNYNTVYLGNGIYRMTIQPNATYGKDSYIDSLNPTLNYDGNNLSLFGQSDPPQYTILIEFNLSYFSGLYNPPIILNANLTLIKSGGTGGGPTYYTNIQRITSSWSESSVSWNTTPSSDPFGYYSTTIPSGSGGQPLSYGVTDLVKRWVNGTSPNFGARIYGTFSGGDFAYFYSSDTGNSTTRPKLVIDYQTIGDNYTANFTVNGIGQGHYAWNCKAADFEGYSAFASSNFSFDINPCLPPSQGDWNITQTCTLNNYAGSSVSGKTYISPLGSLTITNSRLILNETIVDGTFKAINSKSTIWQNGNLTINGNYTLQNSTLRMNGTSPNGAIGILVNNTGTMIINQSSNITNGQTSTYKYFFIVNPGSSFSMTNSSLSYSGWADTQGMMGLELSTTATNFSGNTITSTYDGIVLYSDNNTVGNNTLYNIGHYGIRIFSQNNTISNNLIQNASTGIYFDTSLFDSFSGEMPSYNNITSNLINSSRTRGIYLTSSNNQIISNNITYGTSGASFSGAIVTYYGSNYQYNNIISNNRIENNLGVGIGHASIIGFGLSTSLINNNLIRNNTYGIRFNYYFPDNVLRDNIISNNTASDVVLGQGSTNNLFLNTTFNKSSVSIPQTTPSGSMIVQWYLDTRVLEEGVSPVSGANVSMYNSTANGGQLLFWELTNSSGFISRKNITEYIHSNASIINWNNYTLQANKTAFANASGQLNITQSMLFNLSSQNVAPQISFVPPTEANNTLLNRRWFNANFSIIEKYPAEIGFNLNGTNYSLYNNSLVLFMNFDNVSALEENSSIVADLSGKKNNGIVLGSAFWNATGGKYHGAYEFNGSNGVQINKLTNYSTDAFTFESWIKPKLSGWIFDDSDSSNKGFALLLSSQQINVLIDLSQVLTSSSTLPINQWSYIVLTANSSGMRLYINGNFDSSNTSNVIGPFFGSSRPFYVGGGRTGYTPLNGTIDEVKIYNKTLTPEEVKELYSSNLYKYDIDKWGLYVNSSNLPDGTYTYFGYVNDSFILNQAETRWVTIDPCSPATADDWNISESCVLTNTSITLAQNKNLNILNGGSLTLVNTSLWINPTSNGSSNITVFSGGAMNITSGSLINSTNTSNRFGFVVASGSSFAMTNSTLQEAGWNLNMGQTGLELFANNSVLIGNLFNNNYMGLTIRSSNNIIMSNAIKGNALNGVQILKSGTQLINNTVIYNNLTNNGDDGVYIMYTSIMNNISFNNISSNTNYGIVLWGFIGNSTIFRNNITSNGMDGIYITNTAYNNILDSNNITFNRHGINIYLSSLNNSIFSNYIANNTQIGILLTNNANNTFVLNNTLINNNESIVITDSFFNMIKDTNINFSKTNDIHIYGQGQNTFLNTTFNKSRVFFELAATGSINVQWYLGINVKNSSLAPLSPANVYAYDRNTNPIFGVTTNPSGDIITQNATEYTRDVTGLYYLTNYTINVTSIGYQDYSTQFNFSNSTQLNIIMNALPIVQNVVLNATSLFNSTKDNLTVYYNSYDADGDRVVNITNWRVNASSITLLNLPFETSLSIINGSVNDYSGFGNIGYLGNSSVANSVPAWVASGIVGGAYNFTGTNTLIRINKSSSLGNLNAFSFEAWIKPKATVHPTYIFDNYNGTPANSNGDIRVYISTLSLFASVDGVGLPSTGLLADQWYHIVLTLNNSGSGNMSLYINGGLNKSTTISTAPFLDNNNDFYIGSMINGQNSFNGLIDELRIYNRSLSPEQIYQNYLAGLAGKSPEKIVRSELRNNDVWQVALTPNDAKTDGITVLSNPVTIVNALPVVQNVILNSSSGLNLTKDNLSVYYNSFDPDGNPITNITDWRVNGTSIAVLNLPFDTQVSGVNSSVKDYSTFANNCILGNTSLGSAPIWNASGKIGGAYSFDGISDIINCGNSASLDLNKTLTIEAWIKPAMANENGNNYGVIAKAMNPGWSWQLRFGASNDGTGFPNTNNLGFQFNNNSAGSVPGKWVNIDRALTIGQWYYIVGTYNGTHISIYLNGVLNQTNPLTLFYSNSSVPLLIGNEGWPGNFFNGTIDDIRIYNRSLSPEQIMAMYQDGVNGKYSENIVGKELRKRDVWTVALTPNDASQDGITVLSNNVTILNSPPEVTLISPDDGNVTQNRTPTFFWNGSDADGKQDIQLYQFNITKLGNSTCSDGIQVNLIVENYTVPELQCLMDDQDYYSWMVRAWDSDGPGPWTTPRIIRIQSLVSITLQINKIDFGLMYPNGTSIGFPGDSNNTTSDNPPAFILENNGTVYANITINATDLWKNTPNPSNYFQYRVRNSSEIDSFDWQSSQTNWSNVPSSSVLGMAIATLGYKDSNDTAKVDLFVQVPPNEPAGSKQSIITFIATRTPSSPPCKGSCVI